MRFGSFFPSSFPSFPPLACALAACSVLAYAPPAHADPPLPAPSVAPPPAAAHPLTVTPPDIVRLRDGGMVRGTISELAPGGDVVIVTIAGEARRFAMRDVAFAGPVASDSPAPPAAPLPAAAPSAPVPPVDARVAVSVVASEKDLTVHERGSTMSGTIYGGYHGGSGSITLQQYQPLCIAPCTASLSRGAHTLAASLPGGRPVDSGDVVRVDGPSKLEVTYTSHRDVRIGAVVVMGAALAVAVAAPIVIISSSGSDGSNCNVNDPGFSTCFDNQRSDYGTAFAVAGAGIGVATVALFVAILVKDSVEFHVTPATAAAAGDRRSALRFTPTGLGVAF